MLVGRFSGAEGAGFQPANPRQEMMDYKSTGLGNAQPLRQFSEWRKPTMRCSLAILILLSFTPVLPAQEPTITTTTVNSTNVRVVGPDELIPVGGHLIRASELGAALNYLEEQRLRNQEMRTRDISPATKKEPKPAAPPDCSGQDAKTPCVNRGQKPQAPDSK